MDKLAVLRQYFGFSSFREGQQTLIDAVLAGRDVLGVMPTGGGKSLCYELPALLLPGLTLVISPLISLMKDQVMALQNAGIHAGCIHSAMSVEELREAYRDTRFGAYKILYIAPERLLTDGFCALAQELEISLLAVDEAHCISQWGQDFRPSYLKVPEFVAQLDERPVLAAFTATATPAVREDIIRQLDLRQPERIVTGFDRPGLRFGGGALLFLGLGLQNFVQGGGAAGLAAEPAAALGAVSCLLPLAGLLAFPLIRAYNGERGRRLPRYLFYAFYPAQFLVFWLLSLAIERLGG